MNRRAFLTTAAAAIVGAAIGAPAPAVKEWKLVEVFFPLVGRTLQLPLSDELYALFTRRETYFDTEDECAAYSDASKRREKSLFCIAWDRTERMRFKVGRGTYGEPLLSFG